MFKRSFGILLSAFLLIAVFVGCRGDDGSKGGPIDTDKLDFKGRDFIISSSRMGEWEPKEPGTSELEDNKRALYEQIENEVNIKISFTNVGGMENILSHVMTGTCFADLAEFKMTEWVPCAFQNIILPLDDERIVAGGLDWQNEKLFFQPFTRAMNLNGKQYCFRWNSSYRQAEFGWCIYYNKDLLASAGYPDMYQVVRDGGWTWDLFREIGKATTSDNDADGIYDVYGIGTYGHGAELFTKQGAEVVRRGSDGKYTVALDEPAAIEALEFTRSITVSDGVLYPEDLGEFGAAHKAFTAGNVAMVWGEHKSASSSSFGYNTTEVKYGVLPMPKAAGTDKYVNVLGGVRAGTILSTNPDIKGTATIIALMGERFTNDDWKTAYRDEMLQGSDESLEMVLDYIWPNTVVDYSWASDPLVNYFRENIYFPIVNGEGSVATLVDTHIPGMQAIVDDLFNQ